MYFAIPAVPFVVGLSQAFCSLILLRFFCFCFLWCFHCSRLCFVSWYFSVTLCYFYSVGMNGKNTSLKWKWLMLKRSPKRPNKSDGYWKRVKRNLSCFSWRKENIRQGFYGTLQLVNLPVLFESIHWNYVYMIYIQCIYIQYIYSCLQKCWALHIYCKYSILSALWKGFHLDIYSQSE